jgi:hypothetical protein
MTEPSAEPLQPQAASARQRGLDALKAGLTVLVIFHHSALTYGAIGGWFDREITPDGSPSSLLLAFFCTVNQAFFMGLFFWVAGYFTPAALSRHGVTGFIRERALRLGLPLLVFGFALGPITVAMGQTRSGKPFAATLLGLWQRAVFIPGPLWFAMTLLAFSGLAAIAFGLRSRAPLSATPQRPFPSNTALALAAVGCGVVAFSLRLQWPVNRAVWGLLPGYFASYVLLFAAGCVAAKHRWLECIAPRTARTWMRVTCWALPVLPAVALLAPTVPQLRGEMAGGWNLPALVYAFWEPLVAWGVMLHLLLRAQKQPFAPPPAWQAALARRAYTMFVIHPPVLVAIALTWRSVPAPALLKFAITGGVTCWACYGLAGVLLQWRPLRRVL